MKKAIASLLSAAVVCLLTRPSSATCSEGTFTDFYPGDDSLYPFSANVSSYLWPHDGRAFEDFEQYANNVLLGDSSNQPYWQFRVTSGTLKSRHTITPLWKRGFITGASPKYAFRTILRAGGKYNASHRPRRFGSMTIEARFNAATWYAPVNAVKPGFVLFSHYNTEDDFYAAGLRKNGAIVLEKQTHIWAGGEFRTPEPCPYDQLSGTGGGSRLMLPNGTRLPAGQDIAPGWHTMKLESFWNGADNQLKFWVDGVDQWPDTIILDNTFGWGTGGIRTDYVDAWLDDVKMY